MWKGYRAPWKYYALRKQWFSGAIGYSKKGVIGILRKTKYIDIPFEDPLYQKLKVSLGDSYVSITFNSQNFTPKTSREIEVKFYVEHVERFQRLIRS